MKVTKKNYKTGRYKSRFLCEQDSDDGDSGDDGGDSDFEESRKKRV